MDYTQLKTALERFGEMLSAFHDKSAERSALERDAIKDSLVKRFEYSLEVAWKTCKRHLFEQGFAEARTGSPKSIMRLAAEAGVIADATSWMSYINARQSNSHDYAEEKAADVLKVVDDFGRDAIVLCEKLSGLPWKK